ncbi:HAD family hydrolase [Lacinutrix sp. Hel_I_90]|uniref:KdsC family phosphatase n=1 Tax=Lacinutrix sp. Hel_I_90 TaxID=1249999 RepID=UPI0005CB3514|nr:HAD-IIIA family hydrolase [Lacinutrix sp. Hel_I_90]
MADDKSYKESLKHITSFIFDIDGVLTDGSLLITSTGEMLRSMNVKDGYALKQALNKSYNVCVISGGTNEGVRIRLNHLGVKSVYLGAHKKKDQFLDYIKTENIKPEHILYMGDDIPDIPVMQLVGLVACPQDAVPEIKALSHYISHKNGGKGCVRDVIEQVLKVRGDWDGHFDASL